MATPPAPHGAPVASPLLDGIESPPLGERFWVALGISSAGTLGLVSALLVAEQRALAVATVVACAAGMALLATPRLRAAWTSAAEVVAVAAVTASSLVTGGATSPLRHLLVLPIVYAGMMKGRLRVVGVTALAIAVRAALQVPAGLTRQEAAELVVEVTVWALLAMTTFLLRSSLGSAARRLGEAQDEVASDRLARAASERRLRLLAESTHDGIYMVRLVDGEPRYEYVNPAMATLSGLSAEDFYADALAGRRFMHPDDAATLDRLRARGPILPEPLTVRWQHPDGELRWYEVREVALEDDTGAVVGAQGTVHDVTEVVRERQSMTDALQREHAAVEHLQQVDEMKNAFLQSVSHELRTPLTSVVGLSATVAEHLDEIGTERASELLGRVVANARKLDRLLTDLLDVDRMQRGVLDLRLAEVELAELTARTIEESEELARAVIADLQPTTVTADGPKVERVIENLLHNAVRHTPPGTEVRIAVRPVADGAEIVVEDQGEGIDPAIADVLFEPFAQGGASARAAKPGTGIGLTLVARFTELHGGTVEVGRAEGGGARFRVWLPSAGQPLGDDVEER